MTSAQCSPSGSNSRTNRLGQHDCLVRSHAQYSALDLSVKSYDAQKRALQVELLKLQAWVKETGQRVVILFEGRDAAGKGGTVKRFMEHLNPRSARVVALEKPTEFERRQWYYQRYNQHLPTPGEILLFDHSWCNRAGVERVTGFCTDNEYLEFMRQTPEFERMLARSGIHLFKFWFFVTRKEPKLHFEQRKTDPLKQRKLSPIDMQGQDCRLQTRPVADWLGTGKF